jgi:hypothetical protein
MNNLIAIHFLIKMPYKLANSFFPQWDFFYGTEEVSFEAFILLFDTKFSFQKYWKQRFKKQKKVCVTLR